LSAIFISYRREDSEDSARALYESLLPQFGKDRVFMDVEAIALGSDFRRAVDSSLSSCGVFLAIIGPTWLNITAPNDVSGKRRLDNPEDTVRQEIATALKKSATLPVIPVLIRGASMPTADQLPDELKDLAYRNALSLNHLDWDANVQKLVDTIRPKIGGPATAVHAPETASVEFSSAFRSNDLNKLKKVLVIGIAAIVVVAAAAAFYFTRGPKPGSTLTVTLVKNPRLTNQAGPVDVSIDDHPSGQIRFDSSGSTPFQFQVPEGEHQIKIANPQSNASCSGTFSVNPKQTKFMLRMRDNGTACALDPAL
jgi:TIR domain